MKKYIILLTGLLLSTVALANPKKEVADSVKVYNLDDVTVYATRSPLPLKSVPAKIEVLPKETITRSSYSNLADILKNNTSVDVIQYNGYLSNVGLRGFRPSGKYVIVLVNGIPLGTDNISAINLPSIDQIEVVKGPFSSIYGTNAMGGVINLISKDNKGALKGNVTLGGGSYKALTGNFNVGGKIAGGLSFDLSVGLDRQGEDYTTGKNNLLSMSEAEKAMVDPSTQGIKMKGSSFTATHGRARLGYDFNPNWSLDVVENFFIGKEIPTGGSIWGVYGDGKKDLTRSSSSLRLRGQVDNHELIATPYYNVENSNSYTVLDTKSFVSYKGTNKTYGAILQDNMRLGDHKLTVGIDSRNMVNITSRHKEDGGEDKPYQPGYRTNNLGLFVQTNLSFLDQKLDISAGARMDLMRFTLDSNKLLNNEQKKEQYNVFSPNIGLKYRMAEPLAVHASFGQAFTAPDAFQKAGSYQGAFGKTIGNPDLKPERSSTLDLGVAYNSYRMGVHFDLTYFNTKHTDIILSHYDMAENATTYNNSDKGRMSGIEILGSYDFGALANYNFSLKAFVNATLMINSEVQHKEGTEWEDLLFIRKQNVAFGLEYQSPKGLELLFKGRYMGKRLEQNFYSYYPQVRPGLGDLIAKETPELAPKGFMRYPAFMTFDAAAYYHFNNKFTLGVNLNNLLDENYAEKDGYNLPGRNFMVKASYSF